MLLTVTNSNSNLTMLSEQMAIEFGSSFSQGDKTPLSTVVFLYLSESIKAVLIRFNSFMVGVLGSRKACRILDPIYQLNALTAQSLVASGGGLKPTVKELVMSCHIIATPKNQP